MQVRVVGDVFYFARMSTQRWPLSVYLFLMLHVHSVVNHPRSFDQDEFASGTLWETPPYDTRQDLSGDLHTSKAVHRFATDHPGDSWRMSDKLVQPGKMQLKRNLHTPIDGADARVRSASAQSNSGLLPAVKRASVSRSNTAAGGSSGIYTAASPEHRGALREDGTAASEISFPVAELQSSTAEQIVPFPEHGEQTRCSVEPVNPNGSEQTRKVQRMKGGSLQLLGFQTKEAAQGELVNMKREVNLEGGPGKQGEGESEAQLLFQGDIMLGPEDATDLAHARDGNEAGAGGHGAGARRRKRKVTYLPSKRWTLPIPYLFDTSEKFSLNETEKSLVLGAMHHLEQLTCISFQEANATDLLRPILSFKKDEGCWSYVGKERGFQFQEVSTGEGCFELGTLLHELGHAIGFWHEHSRPDRDAFVRVHLENVRKGEEFNFNVESWGELDNMDVPYDVSSIMHYGSTYFSQSGQEVTIETVDARLQRVVGQRFEMSFYDVKLANTAYCKDVCQGSPVDGLCQHDGYPDPKACDRCRCPVGLSGNYCQQAAPYQGSAACGGSLFVDRAQSYTISSPSHPWLYPAHTSCSWFIQTRPDMQLVLTVSDKAFMTHKDCSLFPTSICIDFLEVKYNATFGYPGARYCCGLPPASPLRSSANAMLVLFRTRQSGTGGFQANVTAEPCGGCYPGSTSQLPCRKMAQMECTKKWNSTEYVACPTFLRGTSTPDCNRWVTKEKSRLGVCTEEVDTCCAGFQLIDGFCRASSNSSTSTSSSAPPVPQNVPLVAANTVNDNTSNDISRDADSIWSSWSPWQTCSMSCGGCGVQTRTRTCDKPTMCGGQATDRESRPCNTFPCPNTLIYMCSSTRVKEYYCGWTTKCYQRVTGYGRCYTNCCIDYVEVDGKCIPKQPK